MAYIAVAVVVVAVVVILGLGLANVIPGFHLLPSSSSGNPPASEYAVTFAETGLSAGTLWTVMLNGESNHSTAGSISFEESSGSYGYSVTSISGYTVSPASGSVTVVSSPVSVPVTFTPQYLPPAKFTVQFNESGLATGTTWSVTLNGSTQSSQSDTVSFSEVNGSYSYSIGTVSGYQSSPTSGTATVAGKTSYHAVTFTANPPTVYSVTFSESGLPASETWGVLLSGTQLTATTPAAITISEPNGSYPYTVENVSTFVPSPASGHAVVNGMDVSVSITFTSHARASSDSYPVSVQQTGLPDNVSWGFFATSQNISGNPDVGQFGEGSSQTVDLPNGTYAWYGVLNGADYAAPPGADIVAQASSPDFEVSGGPVALTVNFTVLSGPQPNYSVTVSETGLPTGVTWFATLGSGNGSALAGSSIVFQEPNGTYVYNATASNPNFGPSVNFGFVTVQGGPASATIVFEFDYNLTFVDNGTGFGDLWEVTLSWSGNSQTYYGFIPGPLTIPVPNGTYGYAVFANGYTATPSEGNLTINGAGQTVPIAFSALPTYTVTLSESGLPSGDLWSTQFCALSTSGYFCTGSFGTTTSVSFTEPDGYYTWEAYSFLAGWVASPTSGSVQVNGASQTVDIAFASVPATDHVVLVEEYDYEFTDTFGVPVGWSWNVTLGGTTESTTGTVLEFTVPNGTYSYEVGAPSSLAGLPGSGTITVNSTAPANFTDPAAEVFVAFTPVGTLPPSVSPGPGVHPVVGSPSAADQLGRTPPMVAEWTYRALGHPSVDDVPVGARA